MEMNFPHRPVRESSVETRDSVMDAARARQANSKTVRLLRRAKQGTSSKNDDLADRIHCFVAEPDAEITIRGSFWEKTDTAKKDEPPLYHSGSANLKDKTLSPSGTGTKLTSPSMEQKKSHD